MKKGRKPRSGLYIRIGGVALLAAVLVMAAVGGPAVEKVVPVTQIGLLVLVLVKQGWDIRIPGWQVWLYGAILALAVALLPRWANAGTGTDTGIVAVYALVFAAVDTFLTGFRKQMTGKLDEWDKSDEP